MAFAPFLLVRQHFPSRKLGDIPGAVARQLSASGLAAGLRPGTRIALGVGSRGISNHALIVRSLAGWWRDQGMAPFIFPAMGSHGAATARGQAEVLAKYGITESEMGCPVRSSLSVAGLGATPEGIRVVMDRLAYESGGVMLCGRVKWHTDFAGKLESGLFKMMAIGLGKFDGARRYHAHAYRMGLEAVIRSVGRQVLASGKILGGLAILEDGNHDTAVIEAVRVEDMERREEELLELVKGWMPRIPVGALDVLIVNELGKNWSGSGLDAKVVNRSVHGHYNPWPGQPVIERIVLRDISPLSYGNAIGMGMCDVAHKRVLKKVKRKPTYVNSLTSGTPAVIRTPITFATDRECLETAARLVGKLDPAAVTLGWIRNTLDLTRMAVTANLRTELERNPVVEILGPERELEFDPAGDLVDWLGPTPEH
jgi:hypothetical protein